MNMLVDGEWRTDVDDYTDESGAFQRSETTFRDAVVDEPDARFPPEPGRYHLYVSAACPWAHRTLITRQLAGLADAISVSVVDPYRSEGGWVFTPEKNGCTPDHVHDVEALRELYTMADPDATCRVTVPVLWDTERDTIVNNESIEIVRQLDGAFDAIATNDVALFPADRREQVERVIEDIYEPINNGVYRASMATRQEPYDRAVEDLYDALEHWDSILGDQRYLVGEQLTAADVCLFTTLVRFDPVYRSTPWTITTVADGITDPRHELWRPLTDFPHLSAYLRDIYQTNEIAATVNFDHIIEHYSSPGSPPGFEPPSFPSSELAARLEAPHGRRESGTVR